MLLPLALALAALAPCPRPEQTPAAPPAQQSASGQQQVDIEAALRERGVEIEFTGNEVFTRRELLGILSCDERAATYFAEGSAAKRLSEDDGDFRKLEAGLHVFRYLLSARGYMQAKVHSPRFETSAAGRKLVLTVNEGALYRIGKVEFKDSKLISPGRLAEMFPLKAGDVADGDAIYVFLFKRVKRLYDEQGHIQFSADAEPTFHPPAPGARESVVDFLITIEEGPRFTLHSVEFSGNSATPSETLRAAVALRDGEVFNTARLEKSLKNLEALGPFERIDPDKDVDYLTDEDRTRIRLKIRLRERGSR